MKIKELIDRRRPSAKDKQTTDEAQLIIIEVIKEDFPNLKVSEILGYQVDEETDIIVGQFLDGSTNFVYNFSFGLEDPKPTLQRYL